MKIIEKTYNWNGTLTKRQKTAYIVLHHAAASRCSAADIHRIHLNNGWAGIGYHFYITKDGSIYRARPIDALGAHVSGYNSSTLGICFEGNFEIERMSDIQLKAGRELIEYLKSIYPNATIKKHRDLNATACPGKNFPFDKMMKKNPELAEVKEIIKSLYLRGIVTDISLWEKKCASDENAYWLARKICNMTKNVKRSGGELKSVNDIVWELNHRGIILDMALWLKLFKEDKNLYWLGFKAANMTGNGV